MNKGFRRDLRLRMALAVLTVSAFDFAAIGAHAALGRTYESVEADRVHMAAKLKSTAAANYTVHSLALANGGVTREFANSSGVVFAVAWQGPVHPDLRQLLGDHFDSFQSESVNATPRHRRQPVVVHRSDLVVQSRGHPGAFSGLAYLPQSVPASFSLNDLR